MLEILTAGKPAPFAGVLLPKDAFYELKSAESERDVLLNKFKEFDASCPPYTTGNVPNTTLMFLVGIAAGVALGVGVSSFIR